MLKQYLTSGRSTTTLQLSRSRVSLVTAPAVFRSECNAAADRLGFAVPNLIQERPDLVDRLILDFFAL